MEQALSKQTGDRRPMIACGDYIIPGGPSPISRLRNDLVSPANFDYKILSLNRHFSGGHFGAESRADNSKSRSPRKLVGFLSDL